jgi:hypothetical protein
VSIEELRKKEIEESKYLGGDMEHTHLVKGLDYSLLHKIRSELEKDKRMEAYAFLLVHTLTSCAVVHGAQ